MIRFHFDWGFLRGLSDVRPAASLPFVFPVMRFGPHFGDSVVVEWPIARGATDAFAHDDARYSPRIDIAVNTAGVAPGNFGESIWNHWHQRAPKRLQKLFEGLRPNDNPRCSLAIEVVFSGSSKHILGDIANASMMGLYGVVIPSKEMALKVQRIYEYVRVLRDVGKAPEVLFQNVLIIPEDEFLNLIKLNYGLL